MFLYTRHSSRLPSIIKILRNNIEKSNSYYCRFVSMQLDVSVKLSSHSRLLSTQGFDRPYFGYVCHVLRGASTREITSSLKFIVFNLLQSNVAFFFFLSNEMFPLSLLLLLLLLLFFYYCDCLPSSLPKLHCT